MTHVKYAEMGEIDTSPTLVQSAWRRFCQLMTTIFYRRRELVGLENLPSSGPMILCANHVNALVDAVVIQAACPRPIHPLARSGLFRSPLLGPVLKLIQAVPVYRRRPGQEKASDANEASFRRCYDFLEEGRVMLIFPEGQSHSDPTLRPLKTGAARLAVGLHQRCARLPAVVPVGLTFPEKGRFRSELLVQFGRPVELEVAEGEAPEDTVRRFTAAIGDGLAGVTLNVDSWEDLELMGLLHQFFLLRDGRTGGRGDGDADGSRRRTLGDRFRALQQLSETHRWLRLTHAGEVRILREKLKRFLKLCRRYGVRDYHLHLRYHPAGVARFLARSLAFVVFVFPLALWGLANSALPYLATRVLTRATARGRDQYDTAGMLFGLVFFLGFWGAQSFGVYWTWGLRTAVAYAVSLPLSGAVALLVGKERKRIVDNVRVFLLFLRQRGLQDYLRLRRQELEVDVARLARLTRQDPLEAAPRAGRMPQ